MSGILTPISKIVMNGEDVQIIDDDFIDSIYYDGRIIGTANSKSLTFTAMNDRSYIAAVFDYYRGYMSGGVESWTKIGSFIVTDDGVTPSDTRETVKVSAVDFMVSFDIIYSPDPEIFPCTLQEVYEDVCMQAGINPALPLDINGGFQVDSNQFEGYLCVDVLKNIAEITGNYARINANNELELSFPMGHGITTDVTAGNYSRLTDKRDATPVTVLVIRDGVITGENFSVSWPEGVVMYGENVYDITDNLFAWTQSKRQELAPAILDKIKGWSYTGFEMAEFWLPGLAVGDAVRIQRKDGSFFQSYIFRTRFRPFTRSAEAPSYVKTSIAYNKSLDPARRTEIIVDKANGVISSIAEELERTRTELGDLSTLLTQTTERFEYTVQRAGGLNHIRNSVFFNEMTYWTVQSGSSYIIDTSTAAEQTTQAGSILRLSSGQITQTLALVKDEQYTMALLVRNPKTVAGSNATIRMYRTPTDYTSVYENEMLPELTQISVTWRASIFNPVLTIASNSPDFRIADMRIVLGDTTLSWSQFSDELYGKGVIIDSQGVQVRGLSGQQYRTVQDDNSFSVIHGGVISEMGLSGVEAPAVNARNILKIGGFTVSVINQNEVLIT